MPADIRKLAQEAVGDGDIPADCPCGVCVERRRCRTIARALIEALDERDEARRRFHARDAEVDRLVQRISRAFDEVNAPAMGAEPHERIQMLAGERDVLRAATRSADDPCRDENVALDRDCNTQVTELDLLLDERGVLVAPPDVPRSKRLQLRVLSILADRDKLLAALPHALGSCGCERVDVPGPHSGAGGPVYEWPEEHEAAIEWLRGRIE